MHRGITAGHQRTLDYAAMAIQTLAFTDYDTKNATPLKRLRTELRGQVDILPFPAEVMRKLKQRGEEVNQDESTKTPMAKKVHASYTNFQRLIRNWGRISEGPYYQLIAG